MSSAALAFPASFVPWLTAVALLSLRLGAMLLPTPLLSAAGAPVTVRVLLVLALAAALCPVSIGAAATDPLLAQLPDRAGLLIQAAGTELALGATMAVAIHFAFSAFAVAGRLLDVQVGFGLSQVFDPMLGSMAPMLNTAFNQIALLAFFLLNGHHAVLRAIAFSLQRLPLGRTWAADTALLPVLKQAAALFSLSFALVAPVIFCILLTELALGVIARNLPQMNMLTMGVPIKIVVGLVALSLWFAGIGPVLDRVYASIYSSWDAIFAATGAPGAR
jgi:flagellar biosynthesis protein FliR